jgi:hypothetical protein
MSRKPRLTSNPKSRSKRLSWLRSFVASLEKRLVNGFSEAWMYGRWNKRRGRKVVRHLTVQSQVLSCRNKLNAARRELAAMEGGD